MEGQSNLERLREIADKVLPTLPALVSRQDGCFIEYNVENGTCIGTGILTKEGVIAIQDAFMSKGAQFPIHSHGVTEIIIVYKGLLRSQGMDGDAKDIGAAESVSYPPHEMHSHVALEDTWMIGITIPAGKGYPSDRHS